jgi:TonB family protein
MKLSPRSLKEPDLYKIAFASALMHLLFITLITVPLKTRENEYKSYFVDLVGPAELSKTVGPTAGKGKDETGPIKVKPAPRRREKAISGEGISLSPAEKAVKEIERIRAIKSLSRTKKKKEEKASGIETIRRKIRGTVSSVPGIPGKAVSKDHESYYALITRKIWSEWIYPDFESSGLQVIISIRIDTAGKVVSLKIEESSGNALFDRSAAKAISKAAPMPPPLVEMEIGVRFYL